MQEIIGKLEQSTSETEFINERFREIIDRMEQFQYSLPQEEIRAIENQPIKKQAGTSDQGYRFD